MGFRKLRTMLVALGLITALGACNRDNPTLTLPTNMATQPQAAPTTTAAAPNACPVDGCRVTFAGIDKVGDELKLTFNANYSPAMSGNHFHVFWSKFQPNQVSDNAESKYQVTQGDWEPTDANPFTTTGAVSVAQRGDSQQICVTAGDRDHNVLNPALFDCRDVAGIL